MARNVVIAAYMRAIRHVAVLTALHLGVRVAVSAVMAPLAGLVLGLALWWSGNRALTDQDIAGFVLSPLGALAAIAGASVLLVAVVLDVALMIGFLHRDPAGRSGPVTSAWRLVLSRLVPVFSLSFRLVLRIVGLCLPFIGLAGVAALVLLRAHDINYYLTYRPPEFLAAAAMIGALLLMLAALLVWRLSGWALALHLVLIDRMDARNCLPHSAAFLHADRARVIRRIALWLVVRLALAAGIAAGMAALGTMAQTLALPDLGRVVIVSVAVLAVWALANAVLSALANGALAYILDDLHAHIAPRPLPGPDPTPSRSATLALAAVAVAAGLGAVGAVVLLQDAADRVATPRAVEIIAHRGAAGARPENTLAAVEKALEDRADWVEIDVQEIADGTVVVAHDSDFMKQAGVALKVWEAEPTDLARIDIGSWFSPSYSDARVPTLREVLEMAKGRGRVLIELKYYGHDQRLEERVLQIVRDTDMSGHVMVMSLKPAGVEKMRRLAPDLPAGILAARAIGDLTTFDAEFLAVNTGQLSLGLLRRAHAAGKKVYVWTVDDPRTMSRMISMGVDGIITNEPALAREVSQSHARLTPAERLLLWASDRFRPENLRRIAEPSDA